MYVHIYICVYMCIYIYIYMYVCMYVCMYMYVYIQWGGGYLIPCWFCTFAHWQRNDQSVILMVDLFEQWETEQQQFFFWIFPKKNAFQKKL